MLRYWGNIGKYYNSSKASGFTIEDCYSWLVEALMYALKARKWRDPENPLSRDKNAPDKVINRCIYSRRQYYYYLANTNKRKADYGTLSINLNNDELDDSHNSLLIDPTYYSQRFMLNISTLSTSWLNKGHYFDTFLLNYLIRFSNISYDKEKKTSTINTKNLAAELKNLSREQYNDTMFDVGASKIMLDSLYESIINTPKSGLSKLIKSSLNQFSRDGELKEILC